MVPRLKEEYEKKIIVDLQKKFAVKIEAETCYAWGFLK